MRRKIRMAQFNSTSRNPPSENVNKHLIWHFKWLCFKSSKYGKLLLRIIDHFNYFKPPILVLQIQSSWPTSSAIFSEFSLIKVPQSNWRESKNFVVYIIKEQGNVKLVIWAVLRPIKDVQRDGGHTRVEWLWLTGVEEAEFFTVFAGIINEWILKTGKTILHDIRKFWSYCIQSINYQVIIILV